MSVFNSCEFVGSTVVLDGNEYADCVFEKCKVVVTRGNFSLKRCKFDSCAFEFGGEAANIRDIVLGLVNQGPSLPGLT